MTRHDIGIPRSDRWDSGSGTEFLKRLTASLGEAGVNVRPLPRAEPTTEDLRAVTTRRREPTLFPGLVADWPATAAWTPDRLISDYGERLVTALMDLPADGVLFPREQQYYERTLPFGDFVRKMLVATSAAPCYLAYTPAKELFPAEDYDFDSLIEPDQYEAGTYIWIGSTGTRALLHSDPRDNLFCQIYGEKSIVLLSWDETSAAYPFPDNIANSRIDLANLDIKKFPRLRHATLYSGVLRPGDSVYLPRGCWHDIRSHAPSVSLNHWFGPRMASQEYLKQLVLLGPRYWAATLNSFIVNGVLGKREGTFFFFSPPSTGKRLFNLLKQLTGRS
ncbi:cupin-like domain-containing protein [Amycolatopsis pithecellobii]|uniref:Cupin-like domain-containing protein n=1 Tax=Amycolatopsis pithecellobii TaxID=664692 RepID=A0A6N7Z3C2_9PSEU|nr:cupin-like domain-containing protein [Amycolatopsis pithecellobii]MTD55589.1 cupin-like domain-containing protein [Amycolatopsis pithecellobii]